MLLYKIIDDHKWRTEFFVLMSFVPWYICVMEFVVCCFRGDFSAFRKGKHPSRGGLTHNHTLIHFKVILSTHVCRKIFCYVPLGTFY